MVKAKQRKQELDLQSESFDPYTCSEMDLHDSSSWVVVKKQRVTILLPPLPVVENILAPKARPKPVEGSLRTTVGKKCQHPDEVAPRGGIHLGGFVTSPLDFPASREPQSHHLDQLGSEKFRELLKPSKSSNGIEQIRRFSSPCSFPNGCSLIKQRLRARNLERKLETAGGLSRWLVLLGLGQFVQIFERRSVNKFQLASLTMNKLKDMGLIAVGPRRKLMHAIDCCCGP
ncbi:hypothetical protein CDL15_Pgr002196 [Punica granatum]|uniref:SAM domain-containing protein n=1 Tax=Punica granatum TaxID=22663 RepID=A0A218XDR1_PUNGR|nr:hypothetical protein CDL15_Pgr002196 [Punica granatum]